MNETLCPTDFKQAGQIIDDELNARLINPLPLGVSFFDLLVYIYMPLESGP